jgi:hypothetical protein
MPRKRRGRPESGDKRQASQGRRVPPIAVNADVAQDGSCTGSTSALWDRVLGRWAGPALIAAAAATMALWTWGTWPDVQIDFGVERYIPWRLAEGEVLYRDISFHNGPLSQYFNSLCFRLSGASLRTLIFCNLALLAALIALLYYALRQIAGRRATTGACLVFVVLFAFAGFLFIGNYNYVCPYAHEMTHGLLLSLLALVVAWPSERGKGRGERGKGNKSPGLQIPEFAPQSATPNPLADGPHPGPLPKREGTFGAVRPYSVIRCAASGLLLGLAFLTKAEVFLAGATGVVTALGVGIALQWPGWRRALVRVSCFAIALAVAPVTAFLCLASAMPARQACLGTLGSWVIAAKGEMLNLPFYRVGQGLDNPWQNVLVMLAMTGVYVAALAPAGIIGLALRKPGRYRRLVAAVVFAATTIGFWTLRQSIPWGEMARPLPLFVLLAIVAALAGFALRRREPSARRQLVCKLSLLVFALVLLGKIFLNARVFHYGFVLAMPAAMLSVVAALDWIPSLIDRRGGYGLVFSAAAAGLLAVACSEYLANQSRCIAGKIVPVGAGGDAFWADWRGVYFDAAAEAIAAQAGRDTTLAVLPEGVMLNCLSGLRNPTGHINFMPVELMLFGEDEIIDCFRRRPPDLIALVHKDTSELGSRFFGCDYGVKLAGWIGRHYHRLQLIGAPPLKGDDFGILLMERNTRGAANTPSHESDIR